MSTSNTQDQAQPTGINHELFDAVKNPQYHNTVIKDCGVRYVKQLEKIGKPLIVEASDSKIGKKKHALSLSILYETRTPSSWEPDMYMTLWVQAQDGERHEFPLTANLKHELTKLAGRGYPGKPVTKDLEVVQLDGTKTWIKFQFRLLDCDPAEGEFYDSSSLDSETSN